MFGSGIAEQYDLRWSEAHLPGTVTMRSLRNEWLGFALAGPRSRESLSRVLSRRREQRGMALRVSRHRGGNAAGAHRPLSSSDELGYEIGCRPTVSSCSTKR